MRVRLLVLMVVLMLATAACDWPMFRFGPAHTGFSPDTSISREAVASGSLVLDWTAAPANEVTSSPAVVNGVVYVGPNGGNLQAFDAAGNTNCSGSPKTCAPLWTAPTAPTSFSSPAVANGVVYIGSDGKLQALDAAGNTNCSGSPKNCQPLWTASTGATGTSSPAVANGVVYIGSDFADNKLYAFGLEKVAPATTVLVPTNGAVLSGTKPLVASASDNVKVSRVEFRLTGGSFNDALIGEATRSSFGWVWNTTSVPNGFYHLNSVAFDPANNRLHKRHQTLPRRDSGAAFFPLDSWDARCRVSPLRRKHWKERGSRFSRRRRCHLCEY